MLDYAYNLKSFQFLPGLVDCQSLADFYEQLANILAKRVLDRARQGYYRAYLAESDRLPYLRGRLEVGHWLRKPGQVELQCHYEEHTADVADNQILAWTLQRIARSGLCTERVLPTIRRAYRTLQGLVTPAPFDPEACVGRLYHRLNDDYRPLHALCRFFLEQSGPGYQLGDRTMLPFLVDMARLYERFVAEWLKLHLPDNFRLKVRERVDISRTNTLHFEIDLVLYEAESGLARYVLDTKYKTSAGPAPADIHQMISYAHTKNCPEAILIYPEPLPQPFDETIRGIRVRSLTFSLDGDLTQAGEEFWQDLSIETRI
jgi:5-methylcytosine-specific restriction enzyme subunit McrC